MSKKPMTDEELKVTIEDELAVADAQNAHEYEDDLVKSIFAAQQRYKEQLNQIREDYHKALWDIFEQYRERHQDTP